MYLRTRLLLGIAIVTLCALALSVLVPLASLRGDVGRETDSSLRLARVLLALQQAVHDAPSPGEALADAAGVLGRTAPLRHVSIVLVDPAGRELARVAQPPATGGWLAHLLWPRQVPVLAWPLSFRGGHLAELRVTANPDTELTEIEGRVRDAVAVLGLAIAAAALSVYVIMQRAAAQRRELVRRLFAVEEEERRRLARELHDELGQGLTAIKVDAAWIQREATGRAAGVESCAQGIERQAGAIMDLIRGMLARLRPHGLETAGLRAVLQDLVAGWQVRVADRLTCSLELTGQVDELSPELNITLYRLVQECLTNAVRHSRAQRLGIRLRVENAGVPPAPARVLVQVEESGMEGGAAARFTGGAGAADITGGTGILGMRERVEAHGGGFDIARQAGGGVLLTAWLPAAPRAGGVHA